MNKEYEKWNNSQDDLLKNKIEEEEEETEYTCCGVEITSTIRDVGLCPTCLEHI